MKTYIQYSFTLIGLFLFLGSSAQVLPYQKGSIALENGERLKGYLTIVNSQKIAFKTEMDTEDKTYYKAKAVKKFLYGKSFFQSINHNYATFFVRKIARGKVGLYKREFAPNRNKAYFIKANEEFVAISKAKFYDDLKEIMSDASIFEQFDEKSFDVAYNYNQTDLTNLVDNYNLERPKSLIAFDFTADIDTSGGDILGFAAEQNLGNFSLSGAGDSNGRATRIPNTVRNDMVLRSEIIYGQILESLNANNWKKVNAALKYLKPLAIEIEAFNDKDSYNELVKYAKLKQKDKFKKTFVLFVSDGVLGLMKSANLQNKPGLRKLVVRQAFIEFLEIKDELKKTDAVLASKIMTQFKSAFANTANNSKFNKETANITASFQKVSAKL